MKILLIGSVVLLVALAAMFSVDAFFRDILPEEPAEDSKMGALIVGASTVFILFMYWIFLPRKAFVYRDKVRIKYGFFSYNVPFGKIESYSKSKGLPLGQTLSSSTSIKNQIEIVRKSGWKIRISPIHTDRFLEALNRAVEEWEKYQPR